MPIEISPLTAPLGATVTGVDLSESLNDEDFRKIHRAWLEHIVLVFPEQNLSDENQVTFTRHFGEMPDRPVHSKGIKSDHQIHKSVMLVSNVRENGKIIGSLPDGEMHFHTDGAYEINPYRYTMLYALEVPRQGGNTLFANMYRAYDTLPEDLKTRLCEAEAEHGFYTGSDVSDGMKQRLRISDYQNSARHPVFIRHEETGRTSLYVSRLLTESLTGFPEGESQNLLSQLFDHSERPEFVYEHIWNPGDFVVWDNRCANHARTDFGDSERRMLRRTTIQGIGPERARVPGRG
ncbi:MAG: TauD/TfdA family dioxygenase [Pseudomonadota bacterium]|nr:TauD/TfdA family dioxygenase [Pseudomonadota bacterium]